jgi:2-oxoglutarate ferredoxin oxidoreductase subunit alpha
MFARGVMRMGVPVATRNIFPSNIQGLPTWFEVRVSEAGWLGARGGADLVVAMNPQTFDKDVASIEPGGYLFYDNSRAIPARNFRDDIVVIGVPLTEICNANTPIPRQRQLFKNIICVGALCALLDMEVAEVFEELLGEQFAGKDKLIAANHKALRIGYDWAKASLTCPIGLTVRRADGVGDRSMSKAIPPPRSARSMAARRCCAWYPLTPSTSLAEGLHRAIARSCASSPRPAPSATPSCRPRTNSPPSAWSSARAGTARAPSPRPPAPASR